VNYKERFAKATVPDIKDFHGKYAVKLVVPLIPDIRFFGHFKFFPNLAAGEKGYNCFLGLVKIGAFRMERGTSSLDGQDVLKIIYDDPSNPLPLKLLTDEVREERPGFYFCRGAYNILGKVINIMYFTVEKME